MPHVSGLLALPLVCMHLGLCAECVCVCVFHLGACVCVCVCLGKGREDMQSESLQNFSHIKRCIFVRERDINAVLLFRYMMAA